MSRTHWYNPILLAPAFERVMTGSPARLPLAASAPAALIAEHALPEFYGVDTGAYISDEAPPALVLCQSPIHGGYDESNDPATHLAQLFAPWLPDVHLLSYPIEHARSTLTSLEIVELIVRGGRVEARRWPIAALIPRARWLGLRVGDQGFRLEDELLHVVATRPDPPPDLLAHLEGVASLDLSIALEQIYLGRSALHNVPGVVRRADAVMALGRGAHFAEMCDRLHEATDPFVEGLLQQLRTTRPPHGAPLFDEFHETYAPSGALAQLRRVLTTAGPGPIDAECSLFAPAAAQSATVRACEAHDWPAELVVFGELQGSRLCLDTRWRQAPIVHEVLADDAPRAFEELAEDLYTFLDDRLPRCD